MREPNTACTPPAACFGRRRVIIASVEMDPCRHTQHPSGEDCEACHPGALRVGASCCRLGRRAAAELELVNPDRGVATEWRNLLVLRRGQDVCAQHIHIKVLLRGPHEARRRFLIPERRRLSPLRGVREDHDRPLLRGVHHCPNQRIEAAIHVHNVRANHHVIRAAPQRLPPSLGTTRHGRRRGIRRCPRREVPLHVHPQHVHHRRQIRQRDVRPEARQRQADGAAPGPQLHHPLTPPVLVQSGQVPYEDRRRGPHAPAHAAGVQSIGNIAPDCHRRQPILHDETARARARLHWRREGVVAS
mmetsp:Transcript_18959/g.48660  ORF Transcript_18959/g.48660 Transcript_18959/m.48660 type:complete len:302 (-) Transcript_18959:172-1077(-)